MLKSPYEVERKRQKLAEKGNLSELKKTYSSKFPEIKDLNNPSFWDEKYLIKENLSQQDGITKDRIKTAAGYIPKGKKKVLDIGAGMGWIEELLSKDKAKEIHANDFSKVSINHLKKKYKGSFRLQSVYSLKYPEDFFDVILILEVLEHIPPSKTFNILKSISNILKKDGIFILSVPMNEGLKNMKENPNGHVRLYTEALVKAELKIAGFRTIEHKTLFAFHNFYYIKTIIAKLTKRKYPNNIILKTVKV